jgi:hypothetical protein
MEQCLEDFRTSDSKGDQLTEKILSITEKPCTSCMLYVKISAEDETQLSLHAQSSYAQVDLKEGQPITDIVGPKEVNRYMITSSKNKEVIVNIHIMRGNVKVQLFDFGRVSVTKENAKGSTNIQIVVPSQDLKSEEQKKDLKTAVTPYYSAFSLSSFVSLHLTVQPQSESESANYQVSYSIGEQTSYLEDGLITEFTLISKKPSKFLYNSPNPKEPVYIYISAPDTQSLSNLKPIIYGLENEGDETGRMEVVPEKPIFKKKTVNPTMLVHVSGRSHYRVEIGNKNPHDVTLTIGVCSREIIYLPLEHEFPFKLDPREYVYFIIAVAGPGYLKFTLNKCDTSMPYIAYTDDYKDFKEEAFESEEQLTEELSYHNLIKVKEAGSVYFKVRAGDNATSLLTAKASFSAHKIESNPARAGDRGVLVYQLIESKKAEINFAAVVCEDKCEGHFNYSVISSPNVDKIVSHLVCTAVSFDFLDTAKLDIPNIEPITVTKGSDNRLTFIHTLTHDTEYVGVKAVNNKTGDVVYYAPVELINLSGKLSKALEVASSNNNPYWIVGTLIMLGICCVLISYRRYRRQRETYRPLVHEDD